MKKNYIYIINKKNFENVVKIGVTDDIEKRLKTLQTANIEVLNLFHFEEREDAYKIEKKLHKIFHEFRENGEWFLIDPKIVRKKLLQI